MRDVAAAIGRNYYFRKSGRVLRQGDVILAAACLMHAAAEWRLILANVPPAQPREFGDLTGALMLTYGGPL